MKATLVACCNEIHKFSAPVLFFFPAEKNNNMSSTDEPNTARISQYYTYFSDLLAMLIIATHVEFPLKITNDLLTINEDICEE